MKAYQVTPLSISHGVPGRIISGEYAIYARHPWLFPFLLSTVLDFNNPHYLLFARLWMTLISALTDLFEAFFYINIAHIYLVYRDKSSLRDKTLGIFLLSSLIITGTLFSWQVIFILPAILLTELLKNKNISLQSWLISVISVVSISGWFWYILTIGTTSSQGDSPIAYFIKNRSFLAFSDPKMIWWFFKRLIKLAIVLSPLLVFVFPWNGLKKSTGLSKNTPVAFATSILGFTIVFYLLVMPNMFSPHEFQFLLFLPFCLVWLCNWLDQQGRLWRLAFRQPQQVIHH